MNCTNTLVSVKVVKTITVRTIQQAGHVLHLKTRNTHTNLVKNPCQKWPPGVWEKGNKTKIK